jgi:hypothetical protein
MISLTESRKYRHTQQELFDAIDSIQKLGRIKRELGSFSIARNETGLQIIDARFSFILMKFDSRLKYTAIPDRLTELKQIKGSLKEYSCSYTIREIGSESEVAISLSIKLPYGPLGFLVSLMARPLYAYRLGRELKLLGKLLDK